MLSALRPRLIILQPTPYCNINCEYCYLKNRDDRRLMSQTVIDAIKQKIFVRIAPDASPTIVWHAGEPTVAPIAWYEYAHETLGPAAPRGTVFSIQSNGVSLSNQWIEFLRRSGTRIGLSIDGPKRFHDARRKTRAGGPTWALVLHNLHKLQSAGLNPSVISVLHPESLSAADEYVKFYHDNKINLISFSIDEAEGANLVSSFGGSDYKPEMKNFLRRILELAFNANYPLHIREIERVAHRLSSGGTVDNEQVEPWQAIIVAANGDVTSFSPEFMEIESARHNNFCFGNVLQHDFEDLVENPFFQITNDEIRRGVEVCKQNCRYFGLCGGGAPVNKMFENKSLESGETVFCRLSIQSAANALIEFLADAGNLVPMATSASEKGPPGRPTSLTSRSPAGAGSTS